MKCILSRLPGQYTPGPKHLLLQEVSRGWKIYYYEASVGDELQPTLRAGGDDRTLTIGELVTRINLLEPEVLVLTRQAYDHVLSHALQAEGIVHTIVSSMDLQEVIL